MSSEIALAALEYPVLVTQRRDPKVLIVDSDRHVVDYVRYFLGEAGIATAYVPPGPDALATALRDKTRLVIAEILSPALDGFTLCRKLKTQRDASEVGVILFSSLDVRQRALEAGADAFLMKPVSESRLLTTVRGLLDLPQPDRRSQGW